jgi:hypothetical protein
MTTAITLDTTIRMASVMVAALVLVALQRLATVAASSSTDTMPTPCCPRQAPAHLTESRSSSAR